MTYKNMGEVRCENLFCRTEWFAIKLFIFYLNQNISIYLINLKMFVKIIINALRKFYKNVLIDEISTKFKIYNCHTEVWEKQIWKLVLQNWIIFFKINSYLFESKYLNLFQFIWNEWIFFSKTILKVKKNVIKMFS